MTPTLLRPLQQRLGHSLLEKVAGPDRRSGENTVWAKHGPRWFTPQDPIWRVHSDASMFAGGIAALLLQSLHPLAMAGVAGHSGYRGDPWGRLQRTSDYIAITTYGRIADAEDVIAQIRAIHERVRGKDFRGRPYRASDPRLLAWVHAAEAYAFLRAHREFGADRLSESDYDTYVAQIGAVSARLGVVQPPQTQVQLRETLAAYRPELEVSPAALDAARFLLTEPPVEAAAKPGYALLAAGGISLLPRWARGMLEVDTRVALPIASAAGRFATAAVRWGIAGVDRKSPAETAAATL